MNSASKATAEIISILGSEQCDLVNALIKTRILAHQIKQQPLNEWVGWELNGYPVGAEVPEYRRLKLGLRADVSNGVMRYKSYQLPIVHLSDEVQQHLLWTTVRHGVASIASWIGQNVVINYPPDFAYYFRGKLGDSYEIESLWGQASTGSYEQILVQIRSRLLGYILDLQDTFPPDGDLHKPEAASMNSKRDSMFHGAIFGPNTTIQIGNHNTATVTNSVTVGDVSSLVEHLRSSGVPDSDLQLLPAAIAADGDAPKSTKKLGDAVGGWVGGLMGKAATGVWEIGVSAAGTLLAGALSSYYNFPVA